MKVADRHEALLEQVAQKPTASDSELAKALSVSERYVQRMLSQLRITKKLAVANTKYKHPVFGWCNTRTLSLQEK
jgi:DeoR/GlpR family transcriptional regulator of sugar metabolism